MTTTGNNVVNATRPNDTRTMLDELIVTTDMIVGPWLITLPLAVTAAKLFNTDKSIIPDLWESNIAVDFTEATMLGGRADHVMGEVISRHDETLNRIADHLYELAGDMDLTEDAP